LLRHSGSKQPPTLFNTMPTIDTDWNVQAACPLYTKVPTEIRNLIFSYALSAFDNHDDPYQPGEHWCRPGYEYAQILDLRVLQTCKRIYHEYHLLPITQSEFVYYLFDGPVHEEPTRQLCGGRGWKSSRWKLRPRSKRRASWTSSSRGQSDGNSPDKTPLRSTGAARLAKQSGKAQRTLPDQES